MKGILPLLGGADHVGGRHLRLQSDWVASNSYTSWTIPGLHWHIGGIFLIALAAALVGLAGFIYMRVTAPAFFRKQTLTRSTPTLVPDQS